MLAGLREASGPNSFSYGLCTPPTVDLEFPPDGIQDSWTSATLTKTKEEYLYNLPSDLGRQMEYHIDSRVSSMRGRYADFLGVGPGLMGSTLDSDPDLTTMRELKNKFLSTTSTYRYVCYNIRFWRN